MYFTWYRVSTSGVISFEVKLSFFPLSLVLRMNVSKQVWLHISCINTCYKSHFEMRDRAHPGLG